MKVGTDGVLVGAWATVRPTDRLLLDIGTGTGLIALMLAQRTEPFAADGGGARVVGIDIEPVDVARRNAAASPWSGSVTFEQVPVQRFEPGVRFDLVVSNPPFFVDSLTCPDAGRTTARHAVSLPFEALRDAVVRLLAVDGRFTVVLPVEEGARFVALCRGHLALLHRTEVRTTPRKAPRRVLLEFGAADACDADRPVVEEALTIGTGAHESYTEAYRALTRDFYLKF